MKQKKKSNVFVTSLCTAFLFLGVLSIFSALWYQRIYGSLGFDAVLYTLLSDNGGVADNLVLRYIITAFIPAIIGTAVLYFIFFSKLKRSLVLYIKEKRTLKLYPFSRLFSVITSIVLSIVLIVVAADIAELIEYIQFSTQTSTIFEDRYITPSNANIVFPETKQNLICIYLESMETSFLSQELGGGNDINAIPELYSLAQDNVNFSHNASVGGADALYGSTWTIGALVSYTAGIPLKLPFGVDSNDYGSDKFLPGVTTLSDILHQNGYYQTFMVGSDADFGGRRQLFLQHGIDKVYDIFTARKDGIVAEDYEVWWGMEDYYLFEYAKQELLEISTNEQPFAFNMLTVDTHHVGGYVCEHCESEYAEQYENVLSCSSRQVTEFINWVTEQDFYENTTIIICGDHPTMDAEYITANITEGYERKVYNCFINAKVEPSNAKNRTFCTLDMFPTFLASIGCSIQGNRLGLGTNLFSPVPTLCEEMGTEAFNAEIAKFSGYYINNFY